MLARSLGSRKSEAQRRQLGSDQMEAGLPALCFSAEQPAATATHGADMTADITATPAARCSSVFGAEKQFKTPCSDFGVSLANITEC